MSYWYRTELEAPPQRPLLLYLHGNGESGGDNVAQTTRHGPWSVCKENEGVLEGLRGFFRIGPHIPRAGAQWNSDMLRELVRRVREQHGDVVTDRLLVVGISRGGWGALEFAAAYGQELGIVGMVVCCPEHIGSLNAALAIAPVYLFHGDGDAIVELSAARAKVYDDLKDRTNFEWVRVHQARTVGVNHHNCWTHLFAHPDLYRLLTRLAEEPDYRNKKESWPDFSDLSAPGSSKGQATKPSPGASPDLPKRSEAE